MKKIKKPTKKKKAASATKPAKKANAIYLVLRARYNNINYLDLSCTRYKTLEEAKATVRACYESHAGRWDAEDAEENGSSLDIADDGMSFSTVNTEAYSAQTWIIEEINLEENSE